MNSQRTPSVLDNVITVWTGIVSIVFGSTRLLIGYSDPLIHGIAPTSHLPDNIPSLRRVQLWCRIAGLCSRTNLLVGTSQIPLEEQTATCAKSSEHDEQDHC
jgi:hypothetical protein